MRIRLFFLFPDTSGSHLQGVVGLFCLPSSSADVHLRSPVRLLVLGDRANASILISPDPLLKAVLDFV